MSFENISKESNFYQSATGDYGFTRLGDGESTSNSARASQVLEDAQVTTTTSVGDALSTEYIPAGMTVLGKFDSVTCDSGVILVYLAK